MLTPSEIIRRDKRSGGVRVHVGNPVLELDGRRYQVKDFSKTGFFVDLPPEHETGDKPSTGTLIFEVVGYKIEQDVSFTVVRKKAGLGVGVRYKVLKVKHHRL